MCFSGDEFFRDYENYSDLISFTYKENSISPINIKEIYQDANSLFEKYQHLFSYFNIYTDGLEKIDSRGKLQHLERLFALIEMKLNYANSIDLQLFNL